MDLSSVCASSRLVLNHLGLALLMTAPILVQGTTAAAVPSYADIAPIVATHCVACHGDEIAYADVVLNSEEDLISNRAAALQALRTGYMPLGQANWKDTDEGKALLSYLEAVAASARP